MSNRYEFREKYYSLWWGCGERNSNYKCVGMCVCVCVYIQYWTKHLQPNNANLVSLYKSAAFFQFREITM